MCLGTSTLFFSSSEHFHIIHRISELFHGAEAGKLSLSSVSRTDRADRVSLRTDRGSCLMMIMAAAGTESPNKSTEDKTSARRQNEGKYQRFIYCYLNA